MKRDPNAVYFEPVPDWVLELVLPYELRPRTLARLKKVPGYSAAQHRKPEPMQIIAVDRENGVLTVGPADLKYLPKGRPRR